MRFESWFPAAARRSRRPFLFWAGLVLILSGGLMLALGQRRPKPPAGSTNGRWEEKEPPIVMGQKVQPYILWNDPSVLRDGKGFRMWLSGGDARNLKRIVVEVYEAVSEDGQNWDIDPKPVLGPSRSGWDSLRTETPSVVKVGGTYHMYYTGFDEAAGKSGITQIGHATSTDGIVWEKDRANPVVTGQNRDKHEWGYGGVGEPGVVYNPRDRTFYLYYAGLQVSRDGKEHGLMGILLATSKDGSKFEPYKVDGRQKLILHRGVPGAPKNAWFGYSTPSAVINERGGIDLFATFVVAPKGPATTRHVVLAHATSSDGINFETSEENMFEAGRGDWKDFQVRSPSVVLYRGRYHMWFAGERHSPFGAAIGYAVSK